MIEIFNDHGSNNMGPRPRGIGQYEVPICGAIQRQLDDCVCVVVPNDDLIGPVEEFIAELEKKRYKRKPWQPGQYSHDELIEQHEETFRSEVELFARDANMPSFMLMHSIFGRWNELVRDPELTTLPNTLAVAVQIELDKLRADTAAEKAEKD